MPFHLPAPLLRILRPLSGTTVPVGNAYPTQDERWNGRLLAIDGFFMALAFSGAASFYALFAIELGASNQIVGWLTSGPALLNLLWLLPCALLIQRARSYALPMVVGAIGQRILMISLVVVPWMPAEWRPWGLVTLVSLSSLPGSMWGVAMQAAWSDMFSPRQVSRFLSQRWAIAGATAVVSVLLLGKFLDSMPFPGNYQIMYAGLGMVSLASVWVLLRFRLPTRELSQPEPPGEPRNIRAAVRLLRTHFRFVLFEISIFVSYLALYAALPVLRIYWVRDLEASAVWVGALTGGLALGGTLGTLWWGRQIRAIRDRRFHLVTTLGWVAAYPLLSSAFPSLAPQLVIAILAGLSQGGADLMKYNRLIQVSTRKERATFFAVHSIILNLSAMIGPIAGAVLVDTLGTRPVLALAGVLGVLGSMLVYFIGWRDAPSPDDLLDEARPAP